MKAKHILLVTVVIAILSCHKEPTQPVPPPGKNVVRLKDINISSLPSPYYHFEYNDTGNITRADFSSGLRDYNVIYSGNHIVTMEHTINPDSNDKLEYEYSNGDLFVVRVKDNTGITKRHCIFSYSASHQLQQLDWDVRDGNVGYYFEQTLKFSYYPNGNVKEIITHNYPVGPQTEATYTDSFENYDNKVNVDGFSLLHTDLHDLILVPATHLQINNPRRNVRTGDGVNYEVDYTYTYDANGRPLVRTGDVKLTNGSMSGQHFESLTTYSYYD